MSVFQLSLFCILFGLFLSLVPSVSSQTCSCQGNTPCTSTSCASGDICFYSYCYKNTLQTCSVSCTDQSSTCYNHVCYAIDLGSSSPGYGYTGGLGGASRSSLNVSAQVGFAILILILCLFGMVGGIIAVVRYKPVIDWLISPTQLFSHVLGPSLLKSYDSYMTIDRASIEKLRNEACSGGNNSNISNPNPSDNPPNGSNNSNPTHSYKFLFFFDKSFFQSPTLLISLFVVNSINAVFLLAGLAANQLSIGSTNGFTESLGVASTTVSESGSSSSVTYATLCGTDNVPSADKDLTNACGVLQASGIFWLLINIATLLLSLALNGFMFRMLKQKQRFLTQRNREQLVINNNKLQQEYSDASSRYMNQLQDCIQKQSQGIITQPPIQPQQPLLTNPSNTLPPSLFSEQVVKEFFPFHFHIIKGFCIIGILTFCSTIIWMDGGHLAIQEAYFRSKHLQLGASWALILIVFLLNLWPIYATRYSYVLCNYNGKMITNNNIAAVVPMNTMSSSQPQMSSTAFLAAPPNNVYVATAAQTSFNSQFSSAPPSYPQQQSLYGVQSIPGVTQQQQAVPLTTTVMLNNTQIPAVAPFVQPQLITQPTSSAIVSSLSVNNNIPSVSSFSNNLPPKTDLDYLLLTKSVVQQMKSLEELKRDGFISEPEFQAIKAVIMKIITSQNIPIPQM